MATQTLHTIGIIGFGKMAEALFRGLRKRHPGIVLKVMEKLSGRNEVAVKKYQAQLHQDGDPDFFSASDMVVLALKPQDLKSFLASNGKAMAGSRMVSILAGTPLASISQVQNNIQLCRFMPNLAASVGKSLTGVHIQPGTSPLFREHCLALASVMGAHLEIPESLMPAVTALSGSGLALVFQFIHALAMGSTRLGIAYDKSLESSLMVIEGAIEVLRREKIHPVEFVSRVCSPGGTTIEGIHHLEQAGFNGTVMDALARISDRAAALERS